MTVHDLIDNFTRVLINPLLLLLFAVGFLVFVFGIVEFMFGLDFGGSGGHSEHGGGNARQNGKMHMLFGVIGMFIMVAAYTIVQIIQNTFPAPPTGS